jgi:isoleucyl-tRNA synthetase
MPKFRRPEQDISFAKIEEQVLRRWDEHNTFRRSIESRRSCEAFIFYDGPPFANGLPHYGHILTSYVKDTVPRYFTMRGRLVERRWGWDCHGLPVELDAQQKLGLRGVKEVNEYGVGRFNEVCRDLVFTYAGEWRKVIDRIGRWVDWDDQYRTMDLSYMETVMHIFSRLYREGLIYESYKVLAYCTSCQTPLSNFETRLDDAYRDREDPTVTVRLPLVDDERTSLLVWTTTPWTLPSNVAVAVGQNLDYEIWEDPDTGDRIVLSAGSAPAYADQLEGRRHVATEKGSTFVGRGYVPLFTYFADTPGAFVVVGSDFVTEGEGTGLVHIAPAFGEEDAALGQALGIAGPMPVRDDGTFDESVTDFTDLHVFDANTAIVAALRESGRVFAAAPYVHSYPHCWRCDSPLIYRAIDSWMLAVGKLRQAILKANAAVEWIPAHVGPGAMAHGVESAPDWALTRNRFWGSPVPVWKCDGASRHAGSPTERLVGDHERHHAVFVPSSIAELEEVSGRAVTDLHRPAIDEITWPCPNGDGTMRRVPDVLDCWFESGSMPFAQRHWPFEHAQDLDYPSDFIVEYQGQVRGWFYTLLVIATALTGESSFRTCMAHGILLGDDGRKLSKRLRNYPDPEEVLATYGSDALRAALLSSAIVRGGDSSVSVRSIQEASRAFSARLWNAFTFFMTYAEAAGYESPPEVLADLRPQHPLDRYALAAVERLRADVTAQLDRFGIAQAYDALARFLERLSNWYIRLSRRRFWEPNAPLSAIEREPFDTLYAVLHRCARIAAPLLPFLADELAFRLGLAETAPDASVHLEDWPDATPGWADETLLAENDLIERVVTMARSIRAEARVPNRQPLASLTVTGVDAQLVARYEGVLRSEANVHRVEVRSDPGDLAVQRVVPNPRVLGPRLGAAVQDVLRVAREGKAVLEADGSAVAAGVRLQPGEFDVVLDPARSDIGVAADGGLVVALDLAITPDLEIEGRARQLLRHIQELRKAAGLEVSDRIRVTLFADTASAAVASEVVAAHGGYLTREALALAVETVTDASPPPTAVQARISDATISILVERA